jgi:hypothetical protein
MSLRTVSKPARTTAGHISNTLPERDACGNYVYKLTCSKCKGERTLHTNILRKPDDTFVCFVCWKDEKGLP